MLTERQIAVLRILRRYHFLRTAQIRDHVAPHDLDASITRDCMRKLRALEFVRRHQPKMVDGLFNSAPPIFVLTLKGACALAEATGDANLLLKVEPTFRDWMSLNHFCAMSSLHLMIDAAINCQSNVKLFALYFEHEVVDPNAKDAAQKYKLYTRIDDKVLFCPDSAFETEVNGHRRAWFIEREMGSDTPSRVAAKKHKGVAGLSTTLKWKNLFPAARDFRVLAVCPYEGWMNQLRKELMEKSGGKEHWLFCDVRKMKADTFLREPLLYTVDKGPFPFVPAPARSPEGAPAPERRGEQKAEQVK